MTEADQTIARLRAYRDLYGLTISDEELARLQPQVTAAVEALAALWRYDLTATDTASSIGMAGRR